MILTNHELGNKKARNLIRKVGMKIVHEILPKRINNLS